MRSACSCELCEVKYTVNLPAVGLRQPSPSNVSETGGGCDRKRGVIPASGVLARRSTSGFGVAVVAARAVRLVGVVAAAEQRRAFVGGGGRPGGTPGGVPRRRDDVVDRPRRRRRRGGGGADVAAVGQPVLALPLHAAVLEPDLDLALGEAERVRDLDAAAPGQVAVEVELFLELERLVARVGRPRALRVVVRAASAAAAARRQRSGRRRRRPVGSAADARVRRCSTSPRQHDRVDSRLRSRVKEPV